MKRMGPAQTKKYLDEICGQCDFCLAAIAAVKEASGTLLADPAQTFPRLHEYMTEIFRNLHSVAIHAMAVSRILWPRASRHSRRAAYLRELAGLDTENTLPHQVRNHLEHFDERLDRWAMNASAGDVDWNVGPVETRQAFAPETVLRWYDPYTSTYWVLDDALEIEPLSAAIHKIRFRAERARQKVEDARRAGVDLGVSMRE